MKHTCTPKQLKILKYIHNYQKINELSPTYAEIANEFNVTVITVYEHIGALEKRGIVKREKHRARSIVIVDDTIIKHKFNTVSGVLFNGQPISWFEEPVKYDYNFLCSDFALRVSDDFFGYMNILKNDLLIFSVDREAVTGNVVLLSDGHGGDATVTEYGNPKLCIPLGNIKVRGVLIGLVRNFS